jgi:hypothetical protein
MADAMKSSETAIKFEMKDQIIKFRDDGLRISDMNLTYLRFAVLHSMYPY